MMEVNIENYMILETILGGLIILLLLRADWQRSKMIKLLSESRTVFTASQIPAEIPKGAASFTISTYSAKVPFKGAATDNQFMRKKK